MPRWVRVHVLDPPAYTPPYDRALCAALARAGAEVTLLTSRFGYGAVPRAAGFTVRDAFYRRQPGAPGSRARRAARLAQHVPDMLRARRVAAGADVVHFQWLTVQPLDVHLLPRDRPVVITAHDVLPREPRPGQLRAQRRLYERADAVVAHSAHGRERLVGELGIDAEKVTVIPHPAFAQLAAEDDPAPLPPELAGVEGPVVLCFGLIRPYKGIDVLLAAWRGPDAAPGGLAASSELWIVGRPRMDLAPLRAAAPPGVRWLPRFVADAEIPALFRRATLAVLPYRKIEQSGVAATALAFGTPLVLTAVGGFPELAATGAATLVPPGDPDALRAELRRLLADDDARGRMRAAAAEAVAGPLSWDAAARAHLDLYRSLRS